MKKLFTFLILIAFATASYGQLLAPKGIRIGVGANLLTITSLTSTSAGVAVADSNKTNGTGFTTPLALSTGLALKAPSSANNVGFTLLFDSGSYTTPLDNTLYYWGANGTGNTGISVTVNYRSQVIPFNCTLVGFSLVTKSTAACSNETGTLSIRINNTTDAQLSAVITWGVGGAGALNWFSSAALNTNITAGDKIEMKLLTPTWATDATNITNTVVLYFKNR